MNNEEERMDILRLADQAAKDLEREAQGLPGPLVYICHNRECVKNLISHFEKATEDWRKRLPGADAFMRKMYLELIEQSEYELKNAREILELLD